MSGFSKNKVYKPATEKHLVELLDHVRPVCVPEYQLDYRPIYNYLKLKMKKNR